MLLDLRIRDDQLVVRTLFGNVLTQDFSRDLPFLSRHRHILSDVTQLADIAGPRIMH